MIYQSAFRSLTSQAPVHSRRSVRLIDVTATLGGTRDDAQVQAGLDAMLDHWARRGFGNYLVYSRSTDEPPSRI